MRSPKGARSLTASSAYLTAILAVVGLVVAWTAYALLFKKEARIGTAVIDGLPGASAARRPAPDPRIRTLTGDVVRLSDFRGKVLIVDFWATWCPPCRDEVPLLVELKKKHGDRGLEILGLTIEDPEQDVEAVREFVREFQVNYVIGFAPEGLLDAFVGTGDHPIPQTFVFDRHGRLRDHLIGYDPASDSRRLRHLIEQLLSE